MGGEGGLSESQRLAGGGSAGSSPLSQETGQTQSSQSLNEVSQPRSGSKESMLQARQLKNSARKKGIETHFVSKHLGREIKEEAKSLDIIEDEGLRDRSDPVRRVKVKRKKKQENRFRHTSYLGTNLMYDFLSQLESQYDTIKMETIGKSGEGRDVKIVKINANNSDLPVIFIDAGIHAREVRSALTKVVRRQHDLLFLVDFTGSNFVPD